MHVSVFQLNNSAAFHQSISLYKVYKQSSISFIIANQIISFISKIQKKNSILIRLLSKIMFALVFQYILYIRQNSRYSPDSNGACSEFM